MTDYVELRRDAQGTAWLTLNRPEVHNAFDDTMIAQIIDALETTDKDASVRALVLRANGKNFSAGADLGWMKRMAQNSHEQNLEDARQLARLMERLNNLSKPTLALVQGAAYGGAVGLAACCDIVIARNDARFCLSEVKIGLIPAVISPYVVRAIGERQARRYFVTAEAFDATAAKGFGLVHELANDDAQLESIAQTLIGQLRRNSPQGIAEAKKLIHAVSQKPIDQNVIDDTARRIADIRVSAEGQEGLSAFLNKRQPNWVEAPKGQEE
ncbi:Methylglutaconyl-CoA hydratase [Marinobacterium lacunae]|uniref:Methylglutaconyl-CoA hydratase n=1 Tax=Marinobacterium lacunae TaxID=1232683 RepID=A0A081FY02_9GAMM|nr:enoyl-CoA hydratase/isomerase family protein [Marinobacterium lacunae]KEA63407.1 Methylglutaconyl-CoA hydratase [Marinobacterium lacunae]MBR9883464.1 enoyl-CoA hydratase/isomerase family protein [Oceanospirillales bacterium]